MREVFHVGWANQANWGQKGGGDKKWQKLEFSFFWGNNFWDTKGIKMADPLGIYHIFQNDTLKCQFGEILCRPKVKAGDS